jgi:hypothetical protein
VSAFEERRVRRVKIAPEFIAQLLSGEFEAVRARIVTTDMPKDAKVHHVYADPHTPAIVVVIASMEWEPVDPGETMPEFMPRFTVVVPDNEGRPA